MKKFIMTAFIIICLFVLCGCNTKEDKPDYDAIDEVTQYIDLLPKKITLKNEEDVNSCLAKYNALKDSDKELVENYAVLEFAIKKLEYLQNEDEYIKQEYENLEAKMRELIGERLAKDVTEIEIVKSYNAKNEYSNYLMNLTWITSDSLTLSTANGYVNHSNVDVTVTLSCKVTCSGTNLTHEFTIDVVVEKGEYVEFGEQVVTAYYYGSYSGLTELDYKTLDMVIYCFFDIAVREVDGKKEYYVGGDASRLSKIVEARSKGVKILFSLGGWHDDSEYWTTYQNCAASEESRKQIAQSILDFLIKYHLDGIDMDWEYPRSKDRGNYTLLMKEIYNTLKAASPNYIVSAAIPCGSSWIGERFDLGGLNNYLDFFNLMSYDMDDGNYTTNHTDYMHMLSGLNFFISKGVTAKKIVLGCAFYGRIFYGVSNKNNGLGQTYTSKEEIAFEDIYANYLSRLDNGVTRYTDFTNKAFYLYDETNKVFISYDDPQAIQQKCMYSYQNGCGGVMFWTYTQDSTQTLMQAIYDYYHSVNVK